MSAPGDDECEGVPARPPRPVDDLLHHRSQVRRPLRRGGRARRPRHRRPGDRRLVRGREETLNAPVVNVAALSAACALIVKAVASDCASSATNWIYAFVTVAPCGTASPGKRRPTVC